MVKTLAYWWGTEDVCHAECRVAGEKAEAFDCQVIDADCNDCRHYVRGRLAPPLVSKLKRKDGTVVDVVFKQNVIIDGRCSKFDKPVTAHPHMYTGLACSA